MERSRDVEARSSRAEGGTTGVVRLLGAQSPLSVSHRRQLLSQASSRTAPSPKLQAHPPSTPKHSRTYTILTDTFSQGPPLSEPHKPRPPKTHLSLPYILTHPFTRPFSQRSPTAPWKPFPIFQHPPQYMPANITRIPTCLATPFRSTRPQTPPLFGPYLQVQPPECRLRPAHLSTDPAHRFQLLCVLPYAPCSSLGPTHPSVPAHSQALPALSTLPGPRPVTQAPPNHARSPPAGGVHSSKAPPTPGRAPHPLLYMASSVFSVFSRARRLRSDAFTSSSCREGRGA